MMMKKEEKNKKNSQKNPAENEKEMRTMMTMMFSKAQPKNLQQNQSPRSHGCQKQNPKSSEENSTPDFCPV